MAEETFRGIVACKSGALHIKSFAAAVAHGHRLWADSQAAGIADGNVASPHEGTTAGAAVGGKYGGYNIVEKIFGCSKLADATLKDAHTGAPVVGSGSHARRGTGWRTGGNLERTLIQAFAEDAPHSHDAPGRLAAPLIGV
jgi:hypothetical protein